VKVHFDGELYDMDLQDAELRAAVQAKAERLVRQLDDQQVRPALEALLGAGSLIAVKLGGAAALHHAYAAPVPYEVVDVFAHTLNKLVGLSYTPPEQLVHSTQQEAPSGTTENSSEEA
jgi:hypothetical protein